MDRTQELLNKAMSGHISEDERLELQQALYGLAPSSREYKEIVNVLGISSLPSSVEDMPTVTGGEPFGYAVGADAETNAGKAGYENRNPQGHMFPTLDWMQGVFGSGGQSSPDVPETNVGKPGYENRNPQGQMLPTLDWMQGVFGGSDKPEVSGGLPIVEGGQRITPAAASDAQGSASPGSGVNVDEFGYTDFPQGGGPIANSLYIPNPTEDDLPDVGVNQFPGGYSFSGGNEASVDILSGHPELWARQQAERAGTPNMAAFLQPRSDASLNMATMGLIGPDINNTLHGGSTTPTGRLAASEDFMKQFDAPGVQFVDPADIWNQAFERANNTDFSHEVSQQTGQLMTPEEIIGTTNDALLSSMGFANPETEQWATSLLNNAAQEYMLALANGGTDLSYPAFLDKMGLSNLLG